MECLKTMLLSGQGPAYLIIDALDECSNSGSPTTPRELVLVIMQELIDLKLPTVHICITSRPEIDIRHVLEPLAIYNVRLGEQARQNQDIADFISSFVHSDRWMRRWRDDDKELVIRTLTAKANGM
jgi:hypothetical protein